MNAKQKAMSLSALRHEGHDVTAPTEDDRRMGDRIGADLITKAADGRLTFSFIAGSEAEALDIRKQLLDMTGVRHILTNPALSQSLSFQVLTWTKDKNGNNEC